MIPRKWEWVKDQCVRRGLKDAAKLAGEIDAALLDCYDIEHTKGWEGFCEIIKTDELVTRDMFFYVVKKIEFCVACQVSKTLCFEWAYQANNTLCFECAFAKECGRCTDSDSLYNRFYEAAKGFPVNKVLLDEKKENK